MIIKALRIQQFRSIDDTGELTLGPATLLVGRNNSGKSSLIRALLSTQAPQSAHGDDWRIGAPKQTLIGLLFESGSTLANRYGVSDLRPYVDVRYESTLGEDGPSSVAYFGAGGSYNLTGQVFSGQMPRNLFVPVLSRRKSMSYVSEVNKARAIAVQVSDADLTSRIDALTSGSHSEGQLFGEMVRRVLDIEVGTFVTQSGKQPGLVLNSFEGVSLDRLGEGVSSVVSMLSSLAYRDEQYVYLLEEPENDLHPQALSALIEVIMEAAERGNQFIVSTHSEIVLRSLGSLDSARIYATRLDANMPVPTTRFEAIEDEFAKRDLLLNLGYKVSDPMGWLVLEESTAERVINDVLVPLFVPELAALRTIAAGGTSKAEATFDDLHRTILFLHLDGRRGPKPAWLIIDGDPDGKAVVGRLRQKFQTWPDEHFSTWSKRTFEEYYPPRFSADVKAVFEIANPRTRQQRKGQLVETVVEWARKNPSDARADFAVSAHEVIEKLRQIATSLG